MKLAPLILAALSLATTTAGAQAHGPRHTRWPRTIAVGMRGGEQLPPLSVEATKDGWVAINFLSTRPDDGLAPPSMRMLTDARDLARWTARVRSLLDEVGDTTRVPSRRPATTLGNGRYTIEVNRWSPAHTIDNEPQVAFVVRGCGPGTMGVGPAVHEVRDLLALLDSAAAIAGAREGRQPTLTRPYYASEVSCPARPQPMNAMPPVVGSAEMGTQFVVDTIGFVEPGTIAFLPGTDAAAARAARQVMTGWRFVPAEVDGTPVRQLVQMRLPFVPPPAVGVSSSYQVNATADGWVHLVHDLSQRAVQEWFHPDSVEAFAEKLAEAERRGEALPRDVDLLVDSTVLLGSPLGIRLSGGFLRHGKALDRRGGVIGCAGAFVDGVGPIRGAELGEVARQARANRPSPADPALALHSASDVACPAWLPWARFARQGFRRVWRYPVGEYPASMRASNARADVLASFVVDTTGTPELATLAILPGPDAQAAAVRRTLATRRFRPATRGGRKVGQRVIQVIRFEPPPSCISRDAGPTCQKRYRDR